jgi:hypothetical protein
MENILTDSKAKRGEPDRSLISLTERYEVAYWTKELGVSEEKLIELVTRVG